MSEDDPIVDFVAFCEGFRSNPYLDVGGIWTIGYGFTYLDGEHVGPGTRHLEQPEALALLREQLDATMHLVIADLGQAANFNPESWQLDPLASFVFNIGHTAWLQSTMLKRLRERRDDLASKEFPKWCHVNGKVYRELVWRRYWERHMFEDGYPAVKMMQDAIHHAGHVEPVSPDAA